MTGAAAHASPCLIVAVDVGSVRGKFAWSALPWPSRQAGAEGVDPEGVAQAVAAALGDGLPVALGFECPLSVPIPAPDNVAWKDLGRARTGEGSRSWSAGAGSGSLATGLVQMAWICRRVAVLAGPVATTCLPERWPTTAPLLLWEAFVSGLAKPARGLVSQHAADAAVAAETFADHLRVDRLQPGDIRCAPHVGLNLAYAAASFAGLAIAPGEVEVEAYVFRTPPAL